MSGAGRVPMPDQVMEALTEREAHLVERCHAIVPLLPREPKPVSVERGHARFRPHAGLG
jgi:hypothetical protein